MTKKKDTEETTGSGAPIFRYEASSKETQAPSESCKHLAAIEAHIEAHVGPIQSVYHEIVSDLVHLDILFVPPTDAFPFQLLVTSGVSDRPMKVPAGLEAFRNVELMMAIPADWPLDQESLKDDANFWPIRWLKTVGRLPHEYNSWVGWGHSIPNGEPPAPIADTNFVGVTLSPPYMFPASFFQLPVDDGEFVTFFVIVPVYKEEMQLKLDIGNEELEKRLVEANIGFTLDTQRPNVAA